MLLKPRIFPGDNPLTKIKKLIASNLFILLIFLFFCVLSHGLLIPFLGFYWDDWPMIWFAETQGPMGFPATFSGDRPFLAGIYLLTTSILGSSPLPWQVLGLISRWLLGVTIWWLIIELWPERKTFAFWVGLLSIVFPGFKQQPISVVYSNGLFLLISNFASLALMLMAMRSSKKKNRVLLFASSFVTYAICLFSTEYYIGLDIVRGLLIWLRLGENNQNWQTKFVKLAKIWFPYILILGSFLIWRVFIFKFPTYQPVLIETLIGPHESPILKLLYRLVRDPFIAGWLAWISPFRFPQITDIQILSQAITWLVIIISTVTAWLILNKGTKEDFQTASKQHTWYIEGFSISLIALFFAGWPFWITNLPIELNYPYDRFLLAFMLGSCLFLASLIDWAFRRNFQKNIILALIIGMAIGANFDNANSYRREWQTHNQFFQQLSWRAPDLKPGTMLLTYNLPFIFYSDNSLTAPLNLLYAPDRHSLDLDYYLGLAPVRVGRGIPALAPDLLIEQNFRNAKFTGSTNDLVLFFFSPPGCLRILDPVRDRSLPVLPQEYGEAIALSNLEQIITESSPSSTPTQSIVMVEENQNWCYYFEKADLMRQTGDWHKVVDLVETAMSKGYSAAEPSENLIYLEALYQTSLNEQAVELTFELFFNHPELGQPICDIIQIVSETKSSINLYPDFQDMLEKTDCLQN